MIDLRIAETAQLDGDALNDITGHTPLSSVVEPGGSRIGVAGKVLNIFQRNALGE